MSLCSCYETKSLFVESAERHAHQQPTGTTITLHWCTHAKSPLTRDMALGSHLAQRMLTCGGDLARCQIPIDQR